MPNRTLISKSILVLVAVLLFPTLSRATAQLELETFTPAMFPPPIKTAGSADKIDLAKLKDQKIVVVVAHGLGCPVMRQNYGGFIALEREFQKEATFVFVNGNPQDAADKISVEAKEYGLPNLVGIDADQKWLRAFGLKTVGEAAIAVLHDDGSRAIVFRGGLSDRVNFDRALAKPKYEFLKQALLALKAGLPLERTTAPVFGCSITMSVKGP